MTQRIAVRFYAVLLLVGMLVCILKIHATSPSASGLDDRKAEYVRAVTRGGGFMPWQEKGPSDEERIFREGIEGRKDIILAARLPVKHPVMLGVEDVKRARRNIEASDWAKDWAKSNKAVADYVVNQPDGFVENMIPELSPTNTYGFTCPNCVGRLSQEGTGLSLISWDCHDPDTFTCRRCGQVYPSEKYPETASLVCPRAGQAFTFYLNDRERANPDDRSGRLAWHWVNHPIHVSFSGVIRERKVTFMMSAARNLALEYRLTGDPRYAARAVRILVRLAQCYRRWLYRDYWDTIADCDPMYAAWHDKDLLLEWKRHLCEEAFAADSIDKAAMLQTYWGAGRVHPSTDTIGSLASLALAYDLIHDAEDASGRALWSQADRAAVERDLLLEYVMGAEAYVGGADKADCVNNKAPRIYHAMAAVARSLGLANLADTALRGYEAVRDRSILYDGFSGESPSYTAMFLSDLVPVPDELDGFRWPPGFPGRQGVVDYYRTDPRLRMMFRTTVDELRPDGYYPPLSDTNVRARPPTHLVELGLRYFPEYYEGFLSAFPHLGPPSEYGLFRLTTEEFSRAKEIILPEIVFPGWMTAILRHGEGPEAAMLAMPFSPEGNHRHYDNLALFYRDRGRTILGDHGYVGDMPINAWIKSTLSHNLVVVDNSEQKFRGRRPNLHRMVTTPHASVVEASSDAYEQCREYRRLVVMAKGPAGATFLIDIFRAKGGGRHAYRVFSELASSDAKEGALEFAGFKLPAEKPFPEAGASLKQEDIFGLRDIRSLDHPPAAWQAVWKEPGSSYRLWMLSQADRVEASNGPGQETLDQPGRRVRYIEAVREGRNVSTTFVAVHEPSDPDGAMPIQKAKRLEVPASAGPDAVAVKIESQWGTYIVLSDFANTAEVAGVRFQGAFGLLRQEPSGKRWMLASEARTFTSAGLGFDEATAVWAGRIAGQTESGFTTDSPRPAGWRSPENATTYILVGSEGAFTGFPVRAVEQNRIEVGRFPLPEAKEFRLPSTRIVEK